ncbi:hypothetical protein [Halomicrococcus gelatinilyticus]|uniref:hypothetical protein n=1 Tax=Halomicrococcus gelatinilyticus TaxID=1702103 RepID=UPI002E12282B
MRWAARTFVAATVVLGAGAAAWQTFAPAFTAVRAMTVPVLAAGGLAGFGVGRGEEVGQVTAERFGTVGSALCYVSVLLLLFQAKLGMVGYAATALVGVALLGVRFGHPGVPLFGGPAPARFQETDGRAAVGRACADRGDENE